MLKHRAQVTLTAVHLPSSWRDVTKAGCFRSVHRAKHPEAQDHTHHAHLQLHLPGMTAQPGREGGREVGL